MSQDVTATPEPSPFNLPNALTLLRVVLVPLMGWLFLSHPQVGSWRWAALLVFVLAQVTDVVDGRLARARNLVTKFGKLVDPIADKLLTGMAFVGLSIVGELWWWVTIVILVREWGITLLRFAVLKYGVISANRGGKLKAVLQTIAIAFFLLPYRDWVSWLALPVQWLGYGVMAVAVGLTVLTGLDYIREAVRLRRTSLTAAGRP